MSETDARKALEKRLDEERTDVLKRIGGLEERWTGLWKKIASVSLGLLIAFTIGGMYVSSAVGDTERAARVAAVVKVKADKNEDRIETIEQVLGEHADHLTDLLAGQQAIADAVGAKLPKRKVIVKGVR